MKHWSWTISHGVETLFALSEVNKDLKLGVFWVVRARRQEEEIVLSSPLQAKHTHISRGGGGARRKVWGTSALPYTLTVRTQQVSAPSCSSSYQLTSLPSRRGNNMEWLSQSLLTQCNVLEGRSLFPVVSVLYVVSVVTQYLLTLAHTNTTSSNTSHLSSPSTSFSVSLDWFHFRWRIVDVSKQQIHSFNPLPAVQTWPWISGHCLRDWIENWKTWNHKLCGKAGWSKLMLSEIMTEFHCVDVSASFM